MFSEAYYQEIKTAFDAQMALLDDRIEALAGEKAAEGIEGLRLPLLQQKKQEILTTLDRLGEDEAQAFIFLYSAMPVSDLLDYPTSLFAAYAKHGAFLWKEGPFAGRVPEKLFANYVLHYRVNNEDLVDTRGFFYDKVAGRIQGKDMYHAAIEANYWCCQEATYRSTDGRTQNARTLYSTATGRCGEESTLGTTVLRSLGIPARQVYAPLWAHCDDNHAWVEAWCDGKWYFLGACEPEERLNFGWFIGPASRAMLLHSRWFGKDKPLDEVVGPKGMSKVLNHLSFYAHTTKLAVKVVDGQGNPVPGAKVTFQVLNHGHMGEVAVLTAGRNGEEKGIVRLTTGCGDLYACAGAEGLYGEMQISLKDAKPGETTEYDLTLREEPECWEGWKDMDFHAPVLGYIHTGLLTQEQKETGAERQAACAAYREQKKAAFYDEREAARVMERFAPADREEVEKLLRDSFSNIHEIVRFLEWDASGYLPGNWEAGKSEHWKLEVLDALREKDCWDTNADIIIEACIYALPYAGSVPDEIFFRDLLNPRVGNEMLRLCRGALASALSGSQKAAIRENPAILPGLVDRWIVSMPEQEYESLVTSPLGCLRGGIASRLSKDIFCVTLYRTLGIPARMSFFDRSVQYYRNGEFLPVREKTCAGEPLCHLILQEDGSLKLTDWEHYSIDHFVNGRFQGVGIWHKLFHHEGNRLDLDLEPGIYRIVTTNRQTNGNQKARMAVFKIEAGETRSMDLSMREIPVEAMLTKDEIADFPLTNVDGEPRYLSHLIGDRKALFLWLEVGKEPTEHILNEIYEKKDDYNALTVPMYVIVKSAKELENKTLKRTMEAVPSLVPMLHDFGIRYQQLTRYVGQEVDKLPLSLIITPVGDCIYSDAGYNVGLADILWRILVEETV